METRPTFLQKPTIEIDQDRYEELIKHELQYEQYKQQADEHIVSLVEIDAETKLEESEDL